MELLSEAILSVESADKILIDGFPRNVKEAEEFNDQVTFFSYIMFTYKFTKQGENNLNKQLQKSYCKLGLGKE